MVGQGWEHGGQLGRCFLLKERDSEQYGNNGNDKKSLHLYIFQRWSQQVFRIYFERRDTMIDWL